MDGKNPLANTINCYSDWIKTMTIKRCNSSSKSRLITQILTILLVSCLISSGCDAQIIRHTLTESGNEAEAFNHDNIAEEEVKETHGNIHDNEFVQRDFIFEKNHRHSSNPLLFHSYVGENKGNDKRKLEDENYWRSRAKSRKFSPVSYLRLKQYTSFLSLIKSFQNSVLSQNSNGFVNPSLLYKNGRAKKFQATGILGSSRKSASLSHVRLKSKQYRRWRLLQNLPRNRKRLEALREFPTSIRINYNSAEPGKWWSHLFESNDKNRPDDKYYLPQLKNIQDINNKGPMKKTIKDEWDQNLNNDRNEKEDKRDWQESEENESFLESGDPFNVNHQGVPFPHTEQILLQDPGPSMEFNTVDMGRRHGFVHYKSKNEEQNVDSRNFKGGKEDEYRTLTEETVFGGHINDIKSHSLYSFGKSSNTPFNPSFTNPDYDILLADRFQEPEERPVVSGAGKATELATDNPNNILDSIEQTALYGPERDKVGRKQREKQTHEKKGDGSLEAVPSEIEQTADKKESQNEETHIQRIKRSASAEVQDKSGSGSGSTASKSHSPLLTQRRHWSSSDIKLFKDDNYTGPALPVVKIGVILTFKYPLPWRYQKTRSALEIAAAKIRAPDGPLPNYNVQIVFRDSQCSHTYGVLEAIDLYVKRLAHVFIGPGCDYATAPIARYSYYWGNGIPVLTAAALVSAFKKKKEEYRLLTRVQGSYQKMSEFFLTIMDTFGWEKVGMAFHDCQYDGSCPHSDCYFAVEPIFLKLKRGGVAPFHVTFHEKYLNSTTTTNVLREIKSHCRIVVMCAKPEAVRDIMIKAHELNFDNGEYVFFYIDLFHTYKEIATSWYVEGDTTERNEMARKAYEALMIVVLRMPTSEEYKQFSVDVKARAADMFPNFTYGEEEVNSFVGAFHDAVLLYALALNETLAQNGSITDGEAITKRMWNRTFVGITGNVSIDVNGDRNADYSLLDLNPDTGHFEVVANYFGNTREYEPVEGKSIHWAGGRKEAPPDTPKCGFDGSKCPPDEPFPEYAIVIIVLGSILLIVLIAVFFIYRHIKLEAELAEMNWRVRWDDILFGTMEKNRKLERSGSRVSLAKASIPSDCSGDTIAVHLNDAGNRQLFTKTGYYKGAIVAIKGIHRPSVTVNKPMLLEIKRIKDLQNDHIVRFIGACIDYPNLCVLTEYCPKGSLQDVLENDQIKLDWMFRYSIMQDIVRGMAYLQGTEVRSHGFLKSTNCVVDSRFVVKITDFGLHHLKGQTSAAEEDEDTYSFFHRQLWTAPELLRMSVRPHEGTLKSDVYSFGIICQEIVYRNGVFYLQNLDLSPKEIHQKVRNGLKPWFRPTLEEYDCPCDELAEVIRRCWAEEPAERPDFQALKSIIRKLNQDGDKGNILDNLLSRMEQYANNLEALVEERTADYLQQKKKAENLLYNMLPKKVASQLIRGECVTAEWYDSVSIYFSDICGFTAMSAESTPMQVVDLLNDLYTAFDSIIENFDVYKVETIGDAYMVVSGLPDRNGTVHAREIARMSLSLLKATMSFRVRHRPNDQLKLRIGIHTGPVCAGVVGLKMPRYCLFGDTVNTASRMESNGLPLKIHVSPVFKEVLDKFNTFELELRGNVEMKGKGLVKTYWLLGEKNASDSPGVSLNIL